MNALTHIWQHRILLASLILAVLVTLGAGPAVADVPISASGASVVLEAASGTNLEQLKPTQAAGNDWTLVIALVFGLVGLIWMRRHIARL